MRAFQTRGLLAAFATHDRFDFVRFQVDAADRMIFGIDDQNALLIVNHNNSTQTVGISRLNATQFNSLLEKNHMEIIEERQKYLIKL